MTIENQAGLTDERLMDAAEKYAALYDDDPRQGIKTDVMNAFYAGAAWAKVVVDLINQIEESRQQSATPARQNAASERQQGK